MINVIEFTNEREHIEAFLVLPKKLYNSKNITQNEQEELQLLQGTHVLSHYFKLHPFVVYSDNTIVARACITIYPDDQVAYVGFYECSDDAEIAQALFEAIERRAQSLGCTSITGPVDASFWIKYRLKIDAFDKKMYTGEPYNTPYYYQQFLYNRYCVSQTYISNFYKTTPDLKSAKKFNDRYKEFTRKNYIIKSPKPHEYDMVLGYIYDMLMELYSDFPIFKPIEKQDFLHHYSHFRYILDYKMVKIAYLGNQPVGFFIGVPDYGNDIYGTITAAKKYRIMLHKIRSKRYVMLYMGVKKEHQGLGKAIAKTVGFTAFMRHATIIGALIAEGKVTAQYSQENISDHSTYVLLQKKLTTK